MASVVALSLATGFAGTADANQRTTDAGVSCVANAGPDLVLRDVLITSY
jgi:hypothetical protein